MALGVPQGRIVGVIGRQGDDEAKQATCDDVCGVMSIVHRPAYGDQCGTEHGNEQEPGKECVAARSLPEMELAGEPKGEEGQSGKRGRGMTTREGSESVLNQMRIDVCRADPLGCQSERRTVLSAGHRLTTIEKVRPRPSDANLDDGRGRESKSMADDDAQQAGVKVPHASTDPQRDHRHHHDWNDKRIHGQHAHRHTLAVGVGMLNAGVGQREFTTETVHIVYDLQ